MKETPEEKERGPKNGELPKNDHGKLMRGLFDRTGPIPDGAAQGSAAKWLLENGYSVEEVFAYFDHLLTDPKRDHRISLLTVKSGIGTYQAKKKERAERHQFNDDGVFTRDDAIWLLNEFETKDAEGFKVLISQLREQFL